MKTQLLKHYGKILLTILVLGAGSYFHVDVSKFVDMLADSVSAPAAVTPAPAESVDAGVTE